MRSIARFSVRHRWPVLAVWAILLAVGVVVAGSARDHLRGTDLRIPGTTADRAASLTERQFGSTISIAVLLKGPPRTLERRGPRIVRRLESIDGVSVLSPWGIGGARTLREPRGQAMLTLQVARPFQQISSRTTPAVERELQRSVRAPLRAEVTGLAPLVRGINQATLDAIDRGERLAVPILLLFLLLIFRSPIAALVPAVCGIVVTTLGTAIMGQLGRHVAIDAIALNIVTMIGLALGVDYSLLIVSRFREELAGGASVPEALEIALARAGRTVLFAGTALVAGMLGALVLAPGGLLVSTTIGVIVAAVVAVLAALLLIPAGLAVLGTGVNRWQFTRAKPSRAARLSLRLTRAPVVAIVTLLPLLALTAVAAGLETGPPSVKNIPPTNAARVSYEAFQRDRGAGWSTPYEITFHTRGPITTRARLRAVQRFQDRIARKPGVEAVLGPAVLLERTAALRALARQATQTGELRRLSDGLRRAGDGTAGLTAGLGSAAAGSQALVAGLDAAAGGSSKLAGGVHRAAPKTTRLARGVAQTGDGAQRLAAGSRKALSGSQDLAKSIAELSSILAAQSRDSDAKLLEPLTRARSSVQAALRGFGSANPQAAADPALQQAKENIQAALADLAILDTYVSGYASEFDTNATAADEMTKGSAKLTKGVGDLVAGSDKLAGGIAQTAQGASTLEQSFTKLDSGTAKLSSGISALLGAQGALAGGLGSAVGGSSQLGAGIVRLHDGVVKVRRSTDAQVRRLHRSGTSVKRASNSGYFVLAGIEGSRRRTQTGVAFAVNTPNGGTTARIIVVPHAGPFDPGSTALRPGLERATRATARRLGAVGIVGGPAALLADFDRATTDALPWILLALVVLTFLVLLAAFRAPLLALIAVLLNVITVGAAVGVLVLCFQGHAPLLGGPGYLDAIAVSGMLGVIFGLSIDYEVFLISRMLEGRALTGTTDGAIRYGVEQTTTIIIGAAMIMAGVFLAFAVAPVANIRQFGVGLTVAVLVDATLVRLVLLPALVRLLGDRAFATPRALRPRA